MAGLTVGDLVALITQAGPLGILVVVVIALVKQDIVPGRLYREERDDNILLREKLLQALDTTRKATEVADRSVARRERP